jgi:hypothetical protein
VYWVFRPKFTSEARAGGLWLAEGRAESRKEHNMKDNEAGRRCAGSAEGGRVFRSLGAK